MERKWLHLQTLTSNILSTRQMLSYIKKKGSELKQGPKGPVGFLIFKTEIDKLHFVASGVTHDLCLADFFSRQVISDIFYRALQSRDTSLSNSILRQVITKIRKDVMTSLVFCIHFSTCILFRC